MIDQHHIRDSKVCQRLIQYKKIGLYIKVRSLVKYLMILNNLVKIVKLIQKNFL